MANPIEFTPGLRPGRSRTRHVQHGSGVELVRAGDGWLVQVPSAERPGRDALFLSQADADALLLLLLTRMYGYSDADAEIALSMGADSADDDPEEAS